eukprot:14257085-Heterocapsa_arctica.AAC.1
MRRPQVRGTYAFGAGGARAAAPPDRAVEGGHGRSHRALRGHRWARRALELLGIEPGAYVSVEERGSAPRTRSVIHHEDVTN